MEAKKDLEKVLKYLLPAVVSVVLIVWLFHKVHPATVMAVLRQGCDYWWLLLMCLILASSRSVRGLRWGIQLRAAGVSRMPPFAEMVSIYGAYALNLVFTGVGEAWRCIYVSRRQKAPLSTVVGTDLGDRISDAIMIMALVGVTFIVAAPVLERFMDHYSFGRSMAAFLGSPWLWIALVLLVAATLFLYRSKSHNRYLVKVRQEVSSLWQGFKILFTMRHQLRFWSYTLLIWICYFLQTYICFFAFPFTRELITPELAYGLLPGLGVFIFGSLSIAIPATGGLGPWNLAVIFALTLYGVDQADAATYSMVVWAFQTMAEILLGIIAAGYVSLNKQGKEQAGKEQAEA